MTPAEKEKAKKLQARLDAMKAAGIQLPSGAGGATEGAAAVGTTAAPVRQSDLYKKNNKPKSDAAAQAKEAADKAAALAAAAATTSGGATIEKDDEDSVADDWDAEGEDGEDSWELNLDKINVNLGARREQAENDVEDTLALDNKREQEKLKMLGIERAKRDEENRIKK